MYCLPKGSGERERWLKSIPLDNIPQSKDTVVCETHWPINFEKGLVYGKYRPAVPPVFNCIPKSLVPTIISKKRVTQRAISSKRNLAVDELDEFTKTNLVAKFDVEVLLRKINLTLFHFQVISFVSDSSIVIQSLNIKSGIELFSLNWHSNFKFDCYHLGVRYFIPSLSQNKIVKMNRWSVLNEAINYLSKVETSNKNKVLSDYRAAMFSASSVGSKVYSPATLIRDFEYFSCFRASYELFRRDHHLPSVRTLTKITSKINNLQSFHFVRIVLDSLQDQQRQVVLLMMKFMSSQVCVITKEKILAKHRITLKNWPLLF